MNRICQDVIRETAFEDKYHVDIKRNEEGEVEGMKKRPKDELQVLMKEARKKKKKKKPLGDPAPKLTKSQKWAKKQAEKKQKKQSATDKDRSYLPQTELIKFGEIAHAPPSLVAPRRVDKTQEAPRVRAKHKFPSIFYILSTFFSLVKNTSFSSQCSQMARTVAGRNL